jgi:hypothetical protein
LPRLSIWPTVVVQRFVLFLSKGIPTRIPPPGGRRVGNEIANPWVKMIGVVVVRPMVIQRMMAVVRIEPVVIPSMPPVAIAVV